MRGDLASFQSALARALRGEDTCPIDPHSAGFRFTGAVRRSWCEFRTLSAARAALSLVPSDQRQLLIASYVESGGGVAAFVASESRSLLAFLVPRLPDPSHALTICRMQNAIARAERAAASFRPPTVSHPQHGLAMGPDAELVWCHADPNSILRALAGGPVPPVGSPDYPVFFAPGLPGCVRAATPEEAALCRRLPSREIVSGLVGRLLAEGVMTITGPQSAASATAPASVCSEPEPDTAYASRLESLLSA